MLKQLIVGFAIIIACHLASGSVLPAVLDRYHPAVPADQSKVKSTSSGFSPEQMSELSGICFTTLRIMLDQTTTSKQNINSPDEKEETPWNTNPLGFQQIGERFFYIERYKYLSWFEAENACRRMGGVLATIQDEEELDAISNSLQHVSYWLGNQSYSNGNHFFTLQEEEEEEDLCVHLFQFSMFRENCEDKNLFICEAVQY